MSHEPPKSTAALMAELVDGLVPVRPLRLANGLGVTLAGLAVTVAIVALMIGLRPEVAAGRFDPVFLLATGLFLLFGLACAVTVIVMSRPQVGSNHGGWLWAAAMAALLPLAAVIIAISPQETSLQVATIEHGLECLMMGSALASLTFAVLIWWLRKGAPTSPERAGLLAGVAAGSFGIFAFSLHCDHSDIIHIGLWHSAVVVICAAIGRLAVPNIIRW